MRDLYQEYKTWLNDKSPEGPTVLLYLLDASAFLETLEGGLFSKPAHRFYDRSNLQAGISIRSFLPSEQGI